MVIDIYTRFSYFREQTTPSFLYFCATPQSSTTAVKSAPQTFRSLPDLHVDLRHPYYLSDCRGVENICIFPAANPWSSNPAPHHPHRAAAVPSSTPQPACEEIQILATYRSQSARPANGILHHPLIGCYNFEHIVT